MPITKCRVCGSNLGNESLLQYRNMPKAAQFMPGLEDLAKEKGVDLDVYQCSGCGLIQLNSEPVPYFREVVRASAFSDEMRGFRLNQFRDFVKTYHLGQKKFLEVGCGRGEYLSLLKETGLDAFGVEYSQTAVDFCKKSGLKAVQGFIDRPDYLVENGPFDGFGIFSFLEHLPKPNSVLKGIANNLRKDAVGIVEVPNFDMIREKKLFSEFIVDHLFYFTKDTLHLTLSMNGFDVLDIQEVWHKYILSAVVRKRSRVTISEFIVTQQHLSRELNDFINQFPEKQVAVWGASHQALAILSLAGIGEKIRYVVDSAVFKQGKYTPATHIPIVAPDKLNKDPVKAVIVMAASYTDEVAGIVKERYGNRMTVAILRDGGLENLNYCI